MVAVFVALTSNSQCNDLNFDWLRLLVWVLPVIGLWILDSLFVFLKKNITEKQKEFVDYVTKGRDVSPFVLESTKWREKFRGTMHNLLDGSTVFFYIIMIVSLALDIWLRSKG